MYKDYLLEKKRTESDPEFLSDPIKLKKTNLIKFGNPRGAQNFIEDFILPPHPTKPVNTGSTFDLVKPKFKGNPIKAGNPRGAQNFIEDFILPPHPTKPVNTEVLLDPIKPIKPHVLASHFTKPNIYMVTVSGVVKDQDGNPLSNAHIMSLNKGEKTVGTFTDFDGKFSIQTLKNTPLSVTHLGYKSSKIIADNNTKDITLSASTKQLDEVIIKATPKKNKTLKYIAIGTIVVVLGSLLIPKPKKGLNAVEVLL